MPAKDVIKHSGQGYGRGCCVWSTWSERCRVTLRDREDLPLHAAWAKAWSGQSLTCPHRLCSSDKSAPEEGRIPAHGYETTVNIEINTFRMTSSVILLNEWKAMDIKIAEFHTDPQLEKQLGEWLDLITIITTDLVILSKKN